MENFKKRRSYTKKSLEIHKKTLGETHPDTATVYINLAGLYADQEKYKEAETLYKKSLQIIKKMLGEEHPDYGGGL